MSMSGVNKREGAASATNVDRLPQAIQDQDLTVQLRVQMFPVYRIINRFMRLSRKFARAYHSGFLLSTRRLSAANGCAFNEIPFRMQLVIRNSAGGVPQMLFLGR